MNHTRPDIFLIGAHKAGTTAFAQLLAQHPLCGLSQPKEPGYFSKLTGDPRKLREYSGCFEHVRSKPHLIDASTTYAMVGTYSGVAQRIAGFNPQARAIMIVREPIARIESQWIEWRSEAGGLRLSFNEAVRHDTRFVDSGLYHRAVCAYREALGRDRVRVIFFEDFVVNPLAVVRGAFGFLGLDADVPLDESQSTRNERVGKREDGGVLRTLRRLPGYTALRSVFAPHSVRAIFKTTFTRPIPTEPAWDPAVKRWFLEQVREDNLALLREERKPDDFYNLTLD